MTLKVISTVAVAAAVLLAATTSAWGSGGLAQKPGAAGCVSSTVRGCQMGKALNEAEEVAVSPDGRNVYVTSYEGSAIAVFDRNRATGRLTQKHGRAGCVSEDPVKGGCTRAKALDEPQDVEVSPDGRNVYAVGFDSNSVAIFDRDLATGALTQKPGTSGCISRNGSGGNCQAVKAINNPNGITVSPDGRNVYVTSIDRLDGRRSTVDPTGRSVAIFDRDPATGALTQKPGTAGCISGTDTGGACQLGHSIGQPLKVLVSRDGRNVYVTSAGPNAVAIFDRDPSTGALTQKPGPAGCASEVGSADACEQVTKGSLSFPDGAAISPDGSSLYVTSENSDSVAIFDRDPATGLLAQKPGRAGCIVEGPRGRECASGKGLNFPLGIVVTPDGRSVYVASQRSNAVAIFARDPATGALRQGHGAAACISRGGGSDFCETGEGFGFPDDLQLSPDGKNLYVASRKPGAVLIFDRRVGRRAVASG